MYVFSSHEFYLVFSYLFLALAIGWWLCHYYLYWNECVFIIIVEVFNTITGVCIITLYIFNIKVKRWIAYHGFSINISNDLSKYKAIIPCGLKNKEITTLKKLGVKNFDNINKIIINKFLNTFL